MNDNTRAVDATNCRETVDRLYRDRWTDESTRAVTVDFNVYSTATRLITVVRFTFEFFSSGFVLPQAAISTLSLNSWNFSFFSTWVRVGCEVGIVIFLCGYWLVQLRDLCIARKWYEPLISFHWLYDSMFFSLVILWGVLYLQLGFSPIRAQFAACTSATEKEPCMQPTEFIDLYDLAQQLEQTTLVAVCVGIAGGMKLFRLLAITPTMHLIWTTLREVRASFFSNDDDLLLVPRNGITHSTRDFILFCLFFLHTTLFIRIPYRTTQALSTMTVFFFAFAVINAGFSLAGLALFGHSIPGYRNWAAAFQSLMLFVLGDFDYEAMSNANPAFAATFFWAYNAINVFVMLNVLIAIVCSFFGAVITDVKATSTWRNRFSGSIFIELFTRARTLWWRLQLHCVCAICHAQERRRRRLERVEGAEVKAAPKAEAEAEASGGGGGKQQPPPAACSNTDRASHRRGTHLSNAPDQMFINLLESRNLEVDFDRQLANAMDWSLEARTSLFAFVENLYHVDVREGSNSFVSVDQICAMIGGRPVPRERLRLLQKIFWCKRAKRCGLLRSVVARCRKKRTTTSDDTGGAAGTGHGTVTAVNIQESLFDVVVDASALDIDRNGEGYHDDTAHAATLAIRRCILSITALHFELLDVKTRAPLAESSFNIKEHFFRCGYEMSFDEMWTETNSLTRGNHRRLRGGAAFVPSSVVLIRLRSKHIGGRWGHILARQRGWNAVLRLKTESPHDANRIVRVLNGNSDVRYKHMAVVSHFVSVTENDATLGQVSRTQTSHCSHKSCAARKLIESYTKIKHVFSKSEVAHSSAEVASSTPICGVPGAGAYHRSSLEQPVHSISKLDRFAVQDVGLFGRLTQQTWVINHHNFDATIFTGSSCVIHATFQLYVVCLQDRSLQSRSLAMGVQYFRSVSHPPSLSLSLFLSLSLPSPPSRDIAQLEKSTPNAKQLRLCLEYSTGASVITNSMHLRVRTINLSSAAERERFVVVIRALTSKLRIEAAQTYGEGWMMSSERMLRSIEGDIEVMSRAKARKMKSRGAETAARVRSGLADLIGLCENVKTKTTHDDDAFDESSSSFGAETTTEDIDDEESSG